ncbi:GNAT family N-acetyltransferase [Cohnella sp. CFH 77786]|uniref:GNAT family N-acetyltransferase n=1 Tax=Cohnella sp. CFH 77786 TaxID=2662265 RepID=UPI001C60A86E|nr:GNAT family N-acetyltransferase [Cohnella sp. CFH 77786]MBW5446524.1 GNAT family N-acetyltransferase [Cohnella sp. CFH 77786]
MSDITIHICSDEDLELLANLNRQLIEDEQHDNIMNLQQLKERMSMFIRSDYQAYLFKDHGAVRGYALVNLRRNPLYLRHFFICRDCRRAGYGKRAFKQLMSFLQISEIDIEVMYWNERGRAFWKSLGFKERSIYMRLEREGD